jgi:DNA-binding response OmpR family regulator
MTKNGTPLVLLVEDDEAIAAALHRYLEAAGYKSVRAATAQAAIGLLSTAAPDIVVTDIFLQDGDGYQVIAAVRERSADLPIIAVSGGRAEHDVLAQAARLGADSTIEKPFSYAYLVDTIDRCLER